MNQTAKAIEQVARQAMDDDKAKVWIDEVEHYRGLLLRIIDQTRRRVFYGESVPASEKLVSLFEPRTDIIAKSSRNIQYGHKVNLATEQHGFITYFNIEDGNPADATLYRPVLDACRARPTIRVRPNDQTLLAESGRSSG